MIEHSRIDELWLELAEGSLSEEEARPLREHLASCSECGPRYRRLAAVHRASVSVGRTMAAEVAPAVPPQIANEVLDNARRASLPLEMKEVRFAGSTTVAGRAPPLAARAAERRRARLRRTVYWWGALSAAAAVLVLTPVYFAYNARREAARIAAQSRKPPPATAAQARLALDERGVAIAALQYFKNERSSESVREEARAIDRRWDAGELQLRTDAPVCQTQQWAPSGLVDASGAVALLLLHGAKDSEAFLYDAKGARIAQVSFLLNGSILNTEAQKRTVGKPTNPRFGPPNQEEARRLLTAQWCPETPSPDIDIRK
ncbi:MAG TPA: zf-HC2 domain-containing protein [Myxococcales bacterium]|nr:zf-HC2 domain-containing protein [Myxococcales bacterium]